MAKQKATSKKRNVRVDAIGQLHVHSSFNNIIVSLANNEGQIISWSSAGKMGFRGSKKNTPYAASITSRDLDFSRTPTTIPGLTANEGILTTLPSTTMCL